MTGWISIPNWDRLQHGDPDKKSLPWIKDYVRQLDEDDYRDLTWQQRGLLQDIRRAYSRSQCEIRDDTTRLTRRFGKRVTRTQLNALVQAGYIEIVSRKELAEGYKKSRLDKKREEESKSSSYNGEPTKPTSALTDNDLAELQAAYDPNGEPEGLAALKATIAAAANTPDDDLPF